MSVSKIPPCPLSKAEIQTYNGRLMELMSLYLNVASAAIDGDVIRELVTTCNITPDYAYASYLAELCGLDTIGRDKPFFRHWFLPMIHEMDATPFLADAYYKTISLPEGEQKMGKWTLRMQTLAPYEAFVCNDFLVLPDGRMIPQIGFFTEAFPYPAVLENGREWMTLMPNETVTTLPAVARAHGKVLTYGLGLGYFTFMVAAKDNVTSVTVVERSADVIRLFSDYLLPQFPHRDKITIVQADAFLYAEQEMPHQNFDFVFADIWHDVGDGRAMYEKMQTYESACPNTEFTYWLEDTIRCYQNPELWPQEEHV